MPFRAFATIYIILGLIIGGLAIAFRDPFLTIISGSLLGIVFATISLRRSEAKAPALKKWMNGQ